MREGVQVEDHAGAGQAVLVGRHLQARHLLQEELEARAHVEVHGELVQGLQDLQEGQDVARGHVVQQT